MQSKHSKQIDELIWLCKQAGERFDLIQGAGGNASVRTADETLIVKSSGTILSALGPDTGLSHLQNIELLALLKHLATTSDAIPLSELEKAADAGTKAALVEGGKPSIETLMHAMLGPFTLHTHPIAVTSLVCRTNWRDTAQDILPEAIVVPYLTPGISLALALRNLLANRGEQPVSRNTVVLLENHGLVVAGPDARAVMTETNNIVEKIEIRLGFTLRHYADVSILADLVSRTCNNNFCAYLIEDIVLQNAVLQHRELFFKAPVFPDYAVYLGATAINLAELNDAEPILLYFKTNGHAPRVVLNKNRLFLIGLNIRKCREMEEILKAHILTLINTSASAAQSLSPAEIAHLNNWDAEKFRQKL